MRLFGSCPVCQRSWWSSATSANQAARFQAPVELGKYFQGSQGIVRTSWTPIRCRKYLYGHTVVRGAHCSNLQDTGETNVDTYSLQHRWPMAPMVCSVCIDGL